MITLGIRVSAEAAGTVAAVVGSLAIGGPLNVGSAASVGKTGLGRSALFNSSNVASSDNAPIPNQTSFHFKRASYIVCRGAPMCAPVKADT